MPQRIYAEERTVAASAETVWDIIADLPRYAEWNPWIYHAEGDIRKNSAVTVSAQFGKQGGTYQHRMIAAERPSLFHWCDVGWFTVFADGERIRNITPIDETHCLYRVELRVTGMAAALADRFYGDFMRGGLKAESNALKQRAEQLASR
ncbi:MAG TPA: SRPBCC domain-containing protein [Pseudomonadales bacterium]|jgi:ribosome-associated toxin RatA of RatAB toxin-antitoxin module